MQSYPPGKHFAIPAWPNVEDVNRLGGYNIAYDRLAIIDGEGMPCDICLTTGSLITFLQTRRSLEGRYPSQP